MIKYTPNGEKKAVALQSISIGNSKRKNIEKGEGFLVQEYKVVISGRGNPQGTESIEYYVGTPFEETLSSPIMNVGSRVQENVDFKFKNGKQDNNTAEISNNNTVLILGLIVVGYFVYKHFNK